MLIIRHSWQDWGQYLLLPVFTTVVNHYVNLKRCQVNHYLVSWVWCGVEWLDSSSLQLNTIVGNTRLIMCSDSCDDFTKAVFSEYLRLDRSL